MSRKIEILVVNHKPSQTVSHSKIVKSIQVGTGLPGHTKIPNEDYYDDDGDNISIKNGTYNELTAIYYAWKNLDLDYYGLFHYRRYFDFGEPSSAKPWKNYQTVEAFQKHGTILDEDILKAVEKYDLIVPMLAPSEPSGVQTTREWYGTSHYKKDIDFCVEYIERNYPEIAKYLGHWDEKTNYICNMFIMKKEIFNEYCEFMFDVLGKFEDQMDIRDYDPYQARVTGFLAERMTSLFIVYKKAQGTRTLERQIAYIENTDPQDQIIQHIPGKKDAIPVVLAINDLYVPYAAMTLRSMLKNAKSSFFDIIIMHRDITKDNQKALQSDLSEFGNFTLRFYDTTNAMLQYSKLSTTVSHISIETYFRVFIQDIMPEYKKAIYLDADLIVTTDIAELYNVDIRGKYLAAVRDFDMAGVYNDAKRSAKYAVVDPERREYLENVLRLKAPYDYFQAGVILLNLQEMRKISSEAMLKYALQNSPVYQDQDVLNVFTEGSVRLLPAEWNVLYNYKGVRWDMAISKAPKRYADEYMESRKSPKIVHYGGAEKPWQTPEVDMGEYFWDIAKESSRFFPIIIARMAEYMASSSAPKQRGGFSVVTGVKKIGKRLPLPHGMKVAAYKSLKKGLGR